MTNHIKQKALTAVLWVLRVLIGLSVVGIVYCLVRLLALIIR